MCESMRSRTTTCNRPAFTIEKVSLTKQRGPIQANAYVRFRDVVIIAKVVKGADGLFVGWPAGQWRSGGQTRYWPWVQFPSEGFQLKVEAAVLAAYREECRRR